LVRCPQAEARSTGPASRLARRASRCTALGRPAASYRFLLEALSDRLPVGAPAVKPRAERPKLSETRATVTIGGASFEVSGRTAQLIAVLALHQTKVNEPTAGKLCCTLGTGKRSWNCAK